MVALLCFVVAILASPFKSRSRLEAENAALRHQLIILCRQRHVRVRLTNNDRWFFIQLYRWVPLILKVLTVVRPETLVRWHRAGFRSYWRWKSYSRGGRPQIETDLRTLIRRMSIENPLWGAPRIHSELLKLGFEVAQSSVAKYMVKAAWAAKPGMAHLPVNHRPEVSPPWICSSCRPLASICSMPSSSFDSIAETSSGLMLQQIQRQNGSRTRSGKHSLGMRRPRYLIRDRDRIYGNVVMRRIRVMGIRDKPIARGSPARRVAAELTVDHAQFGRH
jgi:hypothetical protein